MTINTASIANLLRPALHSVFGSYEMYPPQWPEIFTQYTSKMAVEIEVEMKYLGLAQFVNEGAPVPMEDMGQRNITNYIHRYSKLGFAITEQALEDDLYKSKFPMQAIALKNSYNQTREINGAAILNNGYDTSFPIGDGQPLFSLSHPIDGGVYANRPAQFGDLSEATLEQGLIGVQIFKDQAGLTVMTKGKKIVVSPNNQFVAKRILGSDFRPGTANNDINATKAMNMVPDNFVVNQFLLQVSSGNPWILLTTADNGFKFFKRQQEETDVYTDWSTSNLLAKVSGRYSFGCSNARAAWGNHG